jgi:hypothetical protein
MLLAVRQIGYMELDLNHSDMLLVADVLYSQRMPLSHRLVKDSKTPIDPIWRYMPLDSIGAGQHGQYCIIPDPDTIACQMMKAGS